MPDNEKPEFFVTLSGVTGVQFKSCDFKNEREHSLDSRMQGKGIQSIDADYEVKPKPISTQKGCTFENLIYGIYALKGSGTNDFTVEESEIQR